MWTLPAAPRREKEARKRNPAPEGVVWLSSRIPWCPYRRDMYVHVYMNLTCMAAARCAPFMVMFMFMAGIACIHVETNKASLHGAWTRNMMKEHRHVMHKSTIHQGNNPI